LESSFAENLSSLGLNQTIMPPPGISPLKKYSYQFFEDRLNEQSPVNEKDMKYYVKQPPLRERSGWNQNSGASSFDYSSIR